MDVEVLEYPHGAPPRRGRVRVTVPVDAGKVIIEMKMLQRVGEGGSVKPWETVEAGMDFTHARGNMSTSAMRQIPFAEVERRATEAIEGDKPRVAEVLAQDIEYAGLVGPRDSTLKLVGAVYQDEVQRGGNPVQEIAKAFNISRSSATRWVRRARDQGFIVELEREASAGEFNYLTAEQRADMLKRPDRIEGDHGAEA